MDKTDTFNRFNIKYLKPSTQDQMYTSTCTLTFPVPSLLGATYHRYYVRSPPSTVPYRVEVSCPTFIVRDVNTLLNFNCKYDWILAVQFGHAWRINTQPRVNSRREEGKIKRRDKGLILSEDESLILEERKETRGSVGCVAHLSF